MEFNGYDAFWKTEPPKGVFTPTKLAALILVGHWW